MGSKVSLCLLFKTQYYFASVFNLRLNYVSALWQAMYLCLDVSGST